MDGKNEAKHTRLHDAALKGDLQTVKTLLVSKRENVNESGVGGFTALHYAARYGFNDVVTYLVGPDVDAHKDAVTSRNDTALHLAAEAGHEKVVRSLLEAKADPSLRDSKGRLPGARSKTTDIEGILAAHQKEAPAQDKSASALQAELTEVKRKLEALTAEAQKVLAQRKELAADHERLVHEIRDVAPLKALLVAAAHFDDPAFPSIPSVANSRVALRKTLSSCGYAYPNTISADDPTMDSLLEALAKANFSPSSTALIYIGGHAVHDALTGHNFLLLKGSTERGLSDSAMPLQRLASAIARIPAKRKVVLLDCMRHVTDTRLHMREQHAVEEFADRCPHALVLTACKAGQTAAAEPPHPDPAGESVFMTAVLSALTASFGGERMGGDVAVQELVKACAASSTVSASQLLEYISLAVPQKNLQKPLHLNLDTALARDFTVSLV